MPRKYEGPRLVKVPGRNKWYIRDTIDGRTIHASTGCPHGGADEPGADAQAVLGRYEAQKEAPGDTIPELLDARLKAFRGRSGEARVKSECKRLKAHFQCAPEELTAGLVWQYIKKRKATPGACRHDLEALRAVCRKALGNETNETIPLPPKRSPREKFATRQEFAIFAATAAQMAAHVYIMARIIAGTGARRGAVLGLTWDRVLIDQERPAIDFNEPGREITKKRRTATPIGQQLAGELKEFRRLALSSHVVEYMGKPVKDAKKAWANVAEKAGMAWLTPHVLKHSAVSWLAQDGYNEDRISDLTATDRATIRRIYRKVNPEHLQDLADALDVPLGNVHAVDKMRRAEKRKRDGQDVENVAVLGGGRYRDRTCDLAGVNRSTSSPKPQKPLKKESGGS